jgi:hypothetical protein
MENNDIGIARLTERIDNLNLNFNGFKTDVKDDLNQLKKGLVDMQTLYVTLIQYNQDQKSYANKSELDLVKDKLSMVTKVFSFVAGAIGLALIGAIIKLIIK